MTLSTVVSVNQMNSIYGQELAGQIEGKLKKDYPDIQIGFEEKTGRIVVWNGPNRS